MQADKRYICSREQEVSPDLIQQTHRRPVGQVIAQGRHPVVLAIQDTSAPDFTRQTTTKGLGPIGDGGGGLLQHSTLAVTPDGGVLGVWHQIWRPPSSRTPKP